MKYIFIIAVLWAIFKFFVLKNVKNKLLYAILFLVILFSGIINLIFEPSFADLLQRWM